MIKQILFHKLTSCNYTIYETLIQKVRDIIRDHKGSFQQNRTPFLHSHCCMFDMQVRSKISNPFGNLLDIVAHWKKQIGNNLRLSSLGMPNDMTTHPIAC